MDCIGLTCKPQNAVGDIVIFCQGVSFPGRYGHGKPAKPVNTALSALHSFQSYIISVCF